MDVVGEFLHYHEYSFPLVVSTVDSSGVAPLSPDPNSRKCRARFGLDQQHMWCGPCRWETTLTHTLLIFTLLSLLLLLPTLFLAMLLSFSIDSLLLYGIVFTHVTCYSESPPNKTL